MDEDFDVPSAVESLPPASTAKRSTRGSSDAGTGKAATLKICQYNGCDSDCKTNRRHCSHHQRHLDNMRNQISKNKGADAVKAWSEKCKDVEFANSQIEYMSKKAVGLPMFARAPLIDFVQWEQEFGHLVTSKTATQDQPFEEEQWVRRQVNKFGRNREEMVQEWKQKLAGPWKRDYLGYKGALRLWLPAKEFQEKAETDFIKGNSREVSKQKKAPKQFETEAFRIHALEAGFNHGHGFFGGHVGTAGDEEEDDPMVAAGSPGASDGKASASAFPAAPATKRKPCAETLEASEDETEATAAPAKKPRKGANGAGARAALFDSLSRQLLTKHAAIVSKKADAERVQKEEKEAPAPVAPTDATTRNLYNDALAQNLKMVEVWLSPGALTAMVETYNKEMANQNQEDRKIPEGCETLAAQSPGLAWIVELTASSVNVGRKHLLRTHAFMQDSRIYSGHFLFPKR